MYDRGPHSSSFSSSCSEKSAAQLLSPSLEGMKLLCHANVGEPPPASWQESFALLGKGLDEHITASAGPDSDSHHPLDLAWYTWVLSRIHINAFRVQSVLPPSIGEGLSLKDLAEASASGHPSQSPGSAVYFLASLLNHDCDPNLDVLFPDNNGSLLWG
ncbi:hypothetical protein WJX73_002702 [Symbiochloris irregularis]|uniref:SET domain-containing protein n=1 Tax=Symbiochloris irregularis TaxID=706552 RepID=A0AAW1PVR7_9CHLO